ncbi:MAG: TSUP family transporter [Bacteroidota bacterium]|nr:TSUP family transporter [Bacteroidota bacterium]
MEYVIICLVAFAASGLTLFSGFGLGTLLLPAFAAFFPIDMAIALTAVVHFLNNLFKLFLLGRHADKGVVIKFGLPALIASFAGAACLLFLTDVQPIATYSLFGRTMEILPVKLLIALLMVIFSLFDLIPFLAKITIDKKFMIPGGLLTGFLGGLSGHQGALRSMFLIRSGLPKESFIATGVVIACMVDIARLIIYSTAILMVGLHADLWLVIAATLSAFTGAFIGNKLLKKVTIQTIQLIVGIMLLLFAVAMGSGLI